MHVNRNSTTVVGHANIAFFGDYDINVVAVPGQSLINGVVYDLINQVVQAPWARRTDVHSRSLTYRFESFKDLNVSCIVIIIWF